MICTIAAIVICAIGFVYIAGIAVHPFTRKK
jgi:hypothetical protein